MLGSAYPPPLQQQKHSDLSYLPLPGVQQLLSGLIVSYQSDVTEHRLGKAARRGLLGAGVSQETALGDGRGGYLKIKGNVNLGELLKILGSVLHFIKTKVRLAIGHRTELSS